MTVLLDTCTFLWMATDESKLSDRARAVLADPQNRRLLSAASVLEIAIKVAIKKLTLHATLEEAVHRGMEWGAIEELPVSIKHAQGLALLPPHHRDPFDRLLVAQAIAEGIPIVTNDAEIGKYAARVIW